MAQMTRRGFVRVAGSIPVSGAFAWHFDNGQEESPSPDRRPLMSQPKLEHRPQRHYMGIRTQVTIQELGNVIPQRLQEVFTWLGKKGISPAGAPFIRFWVIDMQKQLDIELGVPVATALSGEGRIHAGILPSGRYATLVYTGVRNGIAANAALQDWGKKKGIQWRTRPAKKGTAWTARMEFFLTDPKQEPDPEKWQTEVAYLVADSHQ